MRLIILYLMMCLPCLAEDSAAPVSAASTLSYPLQTCLSCGDGLGSNSVTLEHAGRFLKFCCVDCVAPYAKSPGTYISNLEEQIKASQRESYPLKTCIISGNDLGSMGEAVEYVSGNTLVKFCCAACIEKFEAGREQMLKKLQEARK